MSYREMQNRIDDLNYMRDPRSQPAADAPTITRDIPCPTCNGKSPWLEADGSETHCVDCDDGTQYDVEIALPSKFDVCPVCEGKGTHVNPSIDAGGLTARDFDDDPDFREDYLGGRFDQTCNRCGGKRVVPVVDEDRCPPEDLEAYYGKLDDDAAYRAECEAERRAGC